MISSFNVAVPAGFPSPALDYMEERLTLNDIYMNRPLSTFLINVKGDSMVNAFIPPKARLVVDRSITAESGHIVLAELNGEFTVKFFKKNAQKAWLVPANSTYPDIEITHDHTCTIWGVVTAIITDTKELKNLFINRRTCTRSLMPMHFIVPVNVCLTRGSKVDP